VTAVGWKLGYGFALRQGDRDEIDYAINSVERIGQVRDGQVVTVDALTTLGVAIWHWDERDTLRELWSHLRGVRNDLDHAGMSVNRMQAQKLARKARDEVWPRLVALAAAWGL